jgi:hypothetical protein
MGQMHYFTLNIAKTLYVFTNPLSRWRVCLRPVEVCGTLYDLGAAVENLEGFLKEACDAKIY